ncbi:MAG: protein-L-isoaspartate O-methyltransferase [Gammaproteobacteria bacterium]|nr:protein-L-isoaspartate O-methyltransferase [Gammaproteobacteria bacterium]NIR84145.1 protein-L-isoaspartate O-methyltransferase [Gammaproteobacteria bacterium]NIR89457.1 protein-L-isoaspartate O-methyltransferase [Gammaproteobacteria bacterium]NIU05300.1 protein-L-isoaspartate O-methyltransferase [Gammaproteobacteria bacterium]NIV52240.1 methyltransferase domain-containing protein [Gammaproteobacteria bacterium]
MDFEKARQNMVQRQIHTWEVLDQRVLDVIAEASREEYVPEAYRYLAYADTHVPLEGDEVMMPPREEARLLQALALTSEDRVLEIGTGSGYLTSLLAALTGEVLSIEISPTLKDFAQANLVGHGINNVTLEVGDGLHGWDEGAPYDAIAVTGSVPVLGHDFQRQLTIGGRLFVIVGEAPAMEALLITRTDEDDWSTESLFETVLPPLKGAKRPRRFTL